MEYIIYWYFYTYFNYRTVQPEEAVAYCNSQDSSCVFVETSAKKNFHVDDLFYELFVVANLPLEMAPNHHKRVSTAFGSPCTLPPTSSQSSRSKKCTLSIKRRLSDACGVVAPNVRRPSIRTDLMIMRTKTCAKGDTDSATGSPKINLNRLVRSTGQSEKRSCVVQWYLVRLDWSVSGDRWGDRCYRSHEECSMTCRV